MTKEYKINRYYEHSDTYQLESEDEVIYADLFVDGSFKDFPSGYFDDKTYEEAMQIKKSLVGKVVEVKDFSPLIFSGNHVKLMS